MVEKEMEDPCLAMTRKWIKGLSDGSSGDHELATSTSRGIQLVKAHKGFLLCDFIIHSGLLDENGNWHVSAIATLVDMIATFASFTTTSSYQVTVDFSISYCSTAKVQEEVEIEAKVVGKKDDLTSVIVEVKKKQNGGLVALGKLWTMVARQNSRHQTRNTLFSEMVEKEMEDPCVEVIQKWIEGLSDGSYGHAVETSTTKGIRLVKAHKGFFLCDMIIHSGLLDESGNWHVSAIAILVDMIGSVAPYTVNQCHHVTLDLTISYYSTAKVQEEVEIEAKVVGKKDDLTSVIVEVRKKQNGELVALGKLWMAESRKNSTHRASKL